MGTVVPMLAVGAVAEFRATFSPFGDRPGWWHVDSGGLLLLAIIGTGAGLYCVRSLDRDPRVFLRGAVSWGICGVAAIAIPRFDGADILQADLLILIGGAVLIGMARRLARAA